MAEGTALIMRRGKYPLHQHMRTYGIAVIAVCVAVLAHLLDRFRVGILCRTALRCMRICTHLLSGAQLLAGPALRLSCIGTLHELDEARARLLLCKKEYEHFVDARIAAQLCTAAARQ